MSVYDYRDTVEAVTMAGVNFGVDTQKIGEVWCLYEAGIEFLLSVIVEFVDPDSSPDSDCIVVVLSD